MHSFCGWLLVLRLLSEASALLCNHLLNDGHLARCGRMLSTTYRSALPESEKQFKEMQPLLQGSKWVSVVAILGK